MIDSQATARTFSALAHPSRVDIFRCLLAHHPVGLTAGKLAKATALAPSTLSHHLSEMEMGGVILRRAVGPSTVTTLDLQKLNSIAASLMQICCSVDAANPTESETQ